LASWIVSLLLAEGREVHATGRGLSTKQKRQRLESLQKGGGKLSIFEADLLDQSAFDKAMVGCEYVIHTASPFIISGVKDPGKELIRPAVDGVRNVMGAVSRNPSVRRVVLTSTAVALYGDSCEQQGRGPFTEADWNITSSAEYQP
jgi:nucleoside-diphosphate-sugar epimerase